MKPKEQKRKEAEARQAVYDSLTWAEKVNKLNRRGFYAEKERERKGFPSLEQYLDIRGAIDEVI